MLLALTTRSHYVPRTPPTDTPPSETSPGIVTRPLLPFCRPRPLINGPTHFAGSDTTKNYALLNTDELLSGRCCRTPASFLPCFPVTAAPLYRCTRCPQSERFHRSIGSLVSIRFRWISFHFYHIWNEICFSFVYAKKFSSCLKPQSKNVSKNRELDL